MNRINIEGYIDDTTELIKNMHIDKMSKVLNGFNMATDLAGDVEFWKWMNSNYKNEIFNTADVIKKYIESAPTKESWMRLQLQGKGYEWDWMISEQCNLKNLFNKFDAGINPTQKGIDVTRINVLNNDTATFQHKSYLSQNTISKGALKNTPSDTKVISQIENIESAKSKGFKVKAFQNKDKSRKIVTKRMDEAAKGSAKTMYSLKNVVSTMGQAGAIGAIIGISMEGLSSYNDFKSGKITGKEYGSEVLKSGCRGAIVSSATAGVMIPIQGTIVSAGLCIPITIPIAIAIGVGVESIVAPMFKQGKYKEQLEELRYYDNIAEMYVDYLVMCKMFSEHFNSYLDSIRRNDYIYETLCDIEENVNSGLEEAFLRL